MLSIFVDSSAFVAIKKPNDPTHLKSLEILERLSLRKIIPYTSPYVIAESVNVISRQMDRKAAASLLTEIRSGEYFVITPDENIVFRAEDLYKRSPSKNVSYADCMGFEIMKDLNITWAFSFDTHFKKYGFKRLGIDGWPK